MQFNKQPQQKHKNKNMTTLHLRKSIGRSPLRLGLLLIAIACLALSPTGRAAGLHPPPDGGYTGQNTAEGDNALFSLTAGAANTAMGFNALYHNTTGNWNTAYGYQALFSNTTGGTNNDAQGSTAIGFQALFSNTTGEGNVANGYQALFSNTTGLINTATGRFALFSNTTGRFDTATGGSALRNNTTGNGNTADGRLALFSNTTGNLNTAVGTAALTSNITGNFNIGLGAFSGDNLDTGDNNIEIGNEGNPGEANTIRIGDPAVQSATFVAGIYGATPSAGIPVYIDSNGQLGTVPSSERFKDQITPMDKTSEAILSLRPVTFKYKKEIDPKGASQFGLVAEEVAKVNPALVARDAQGKIYTVRYEAVNAMLLNEFLKEHRTVQELKKEIAALTATVQKVSAQVEMSRPAPKTVVNNH
jgi:Chaperone of endosialidase